VEKDAKLPYFSCKKENEAANMLCHRLLRLVGTDMKSPASQRLAKLSLE